MEKLKMFGSGNVGMSTLSRLNQIKFEEFCKLIGQGLTEGLFKFSKFNWKPMQ